VLAVIRGIGRVVVTPIDTPATFFLSALPMLAGTDARFAVAKIFLGFRNATIPFSEGSPLYGWAGWQ
jgi:hypothetical protein